MCNIHRRLGLIASFFVIFFTSSSSSHGSEGPYFVTYSQYMEEKGDLEIGINAVRGKPRGGNAFLGSWMEFEYGIGNWWTTEFYLDGQWTANESAIFTGFRLENRFRPFPGNHVINPVLYTEYEDVDAADKTLQEIVGFDSQEDQRVPNDIARREHEHEIETRLILGSDFRDWNFSGNFIAEKNLSDGPWEFGYAAGLRRSLSSTGSLREFRAGVEFFGGLGDWNRFTVRDTSQYVGICLGWKVSGGTFFRISPAFGLTRQSNDFLLRFGISQEISHFGRRIRSWF